MPMVTLNPETQKNANDMDVLGDIPQVVPPIDFADTETAKINSPQVNTPEPAEQNIWERTRPAYDESKSLQRAMSAPKTEKDAQNIVQLSSERGIPLIEARQQYENEQLARFAKGIDEFTHPMTVYEKAAELKGRLAGQLINGMQRTVIGAIGMGGSLVANPFTSSYLGKSLVPFKGIQETRQKIEGKIWSLIKPFGIEPFEIEPPKNAAEIAIDAGAGLTNFITQLTVLRKIVPDMPEILNWELLNLFDNGTPGAGASMYLVFGTSGFAGKNLASKVSNKGMKLLTEIAPQSAAMAGVSATAQAIEGKYNPTETLIQGLIPFAFKGIEIIDGRLFNYADIASRLTKTQNISAENAQKIVLRGWSKTSPKYTDAENITRVIQSTAEDLAKIKNGETLPESTEKDIIDFQDAGVIEKPPEGTIKQTGEKLPAVMNVTKQPVIERKTTSQADYEAIKARLRKKSETPATAGQEKTAQVKMMITQADRQALRDLGYTDEQIGNLKPEQAGEIINKGIRNEIPQEGQEQPAVKSEIPTTIPPQDKQATEEYVETLNGKKITDYLKKYKELPVDSGSVRQKVFKNEIPVQLVGEHTKYLQDMGIIKKTVNRWILADDALAKLEKSALIPPTAEEPAARDIAPQNTAEAGKGKIEIINNSGEFRNEPEEYAKSLLSGIKKGKQGISVETFEGGQSGYVLRNNDGKAIGILKHDGKAITDLAVSKTERRKGVGEKLLARALADGITKVQEPLSADGKAIIDRFNQSSFAPAAGEGGESKISEPVNLPAGRKVKQEGQVKTGEGEIKPIVLTKPTGEEVPVIEIDPTKLKLSKDVPNFKASASSETGEVLGQELQGEYKKIPKNPIIVWQRLNGDLEVISGRHRWQLALRNKTNIPAQIFKESEGYDKDWALTIDAESNIMEGQGEVKDYAQYFRHTEVTEDTARKRGLLSRVKGKEGFVIAKSAVDDTYSAFLGDKISSAKAAAIARGAPNNESVQHAALAEVKTMSAEALEQFEKVLLRSLPEDAKKATQGQLFSFDDSAIKEAKLIGNEVAKEVASIKERITAVRGALRKPDVAREMGLEFSDELSIRKEVARLENRLDDLSRYTTDPKLWKEFKDRVAGIEPEIIETLEQITPKEEKEIEQIYIDAVPPTDVPTKVKLQDAVREAIDEDLSRAKEAKKSRRKYKTIKNEQELYEREFLDRPELFINPDNPLPEIKAAWTIATQGKGLFGGSYTNLSPEQRRMKGIAAVYTPEEILDAVKVGLYHIESGAKKFADWSAKMLEDLGEPVRPYLAELWSQTKREYETATGNKLSNETEPVESKILTELQDYEAKPYANTDADAQIMRDELGIGRVLPEEHKQIANEKRIAIREGYAEDAMNVAAEVIDGKKTLTGLEELGNQMARDTRRYKIDELIRKRSDVKDETEKESFNTEINRLRDEIITLDTARDIGTSEAGRTLRYTQELTDKDLTPSEVITTARINKGKELTSQERDELINMSSKYETAQLEIDKLKKQIDEMSANVLIKERGIKKYKRMTVEQKDTELRQLENRLDELLKAGC